MSFIPKNPIMTPEISNTPPTPIPGSRGIFSKNDGWYDIDKSGNVKKLAYINDIGECVAPSSLIIYSSNDWESHDIDSFELEKLRFIKLSYPNKSGLFQDDVSLTANVEDGWADCVFLGSVLRDSDIIFDVISEKIYRVYFDGSSEPLDAESCNLSYNNYNYEDGFWRALQNMNSLVAMGLGADGASFKVEFYILSTVSQSIDAAARDSVVLSSKYAEALAKIIRYETTEDIYFAEKDMKEYSNTKFDESKIYTNERLGILTEIKTLTFNYDDYVYELPLPDDFVSFEYVLMTDQSSPLDMSTLYIYGEDNEELYSETIEPMDEFYIHLDGVTFSGKPVRIEIQVGDRCAPYITEVKYHAVTTAQRYVDKVVEESKAYTDTKTESILNDAKAYTDEKLSDIDLSGVEISSNNVIKKTVIGKTIFVEDVSPDRHELAINVKSKNEFCFNADSTATYNDVTFQTVAGTSVLKANGTFSATFTGNYNFTVSEMILPRGVYTKSVSGLPAGRINLNKFDEVQQKYVNEPSSTFTLEKDTAIRLQIIIPRDTVFNNSEISIQIEKGKTATTIVEHALPDNVVISVVGNDETQSSTVESDGTAKGLYSTYPSMEISANNEDVFIECEYEVSMAGALDGNKGNIRGKNLLDSLVLEQGMIEPSNGNNSSHKARVRTKNYIQGFDTIAVPDGYCIHAVVYYNSDTEKFDSYIELEGSGTFITQYSFGKEGCKTKLVFARADKTRNLTPDELQAVTTSNNFEERISKLEVVPYFAFDYDQELVDVSGIIEGMDMTTSSMMTTVYAKMDALMAENPSYISRVDAAELLGLDYPDYASAYKTYMYKLIDADLPSTGIASPKKKLLLLGGVHGDEPCSIANLYIFAKRLCTDVMNDANLFKLRTNFDIYIVPCVNGYGIMNVTRQNANGININRNYPTSGWFESGAVGDRDYGGASAGSEFETQIVLGLIEELEPTLTIDHHSYGLDGRQFYTGIRGGNATPYIYRSYIDCSLAFKKGLPQYFGSGFGLVNAFISSNYYSDMGQLPDWLYERGYAGGIVEASMCINYNNGVISDTMIDRLGNDTMSVAEYTLRNQVLRYAEYAISH